MIAEEVRGAKLRSTNSGMILSLLVAAPATPSAIAAAYARRYSALSACSERNVRTILDRLRRAELIEPTGEGPALRLTEAGARARREWMLAPLQQRAPVMFGSTALAALEPTGPRREILSRVLAAEPGDRDTIVTLLQDYQDVLLRLMAEDLGHVDRDDLLVALALTERELLLDAEIRWVEIALERFTEAPSRGR